MFSVLLENQPPRNVCLTVLLGLHILIVWDNICTQYHTTSPARYATLRQAEMTLYMFAWDVLFYYWGSLHAPIFKSKGVSACHMHPYKHTVAVWQCV